MSVYETAVARPTGESTVARLAVTAARYGYDGLVIANADETGALDGEYPVDVVDGVTVSVPDVETLAGRLGSLRSGSETRHTVVTVVGGPPAVTRFAAEQDRVDVLLLPHTTDDVGFDHVVAASADDHGVRVALDLSGVLRASGESRVRSLRDLRRRRELLDDAGATPLVTVRPRSHLEVRTPRDLAAVGERVGLGRAEVHEGLAGWGEVVERVRKRIDPAFVEPGVRRGRYDEKVDRDGDGVGGGEGV